MKPTYSFEIDVARSYVIMTVSGFFSEQDAHEFYAAIQQAFRRLRCPVGQHVTLIDIREFDIQSQAIVDLFRQMSESRIRSRRLCVVVAKSLTRMQVRRIFSLREAGFFTSIEDGEAWLLGEQADAHTDRGALSTASP